MKRFWSKVKIIEDATSCWEWQASLGSTGYGQFYFIEAGRAYPNAKAHRAAYTLAVGPVPAGMDVLHKCDNPKCVRPDHLEIGDASKNLADAYARGRREPLRGWRCPSAKLNQEQVAEIRSLHSAGGISNRKIAAQFGVTHPTVNKIVAGTTWAY